MASLSHYKNLASWAIQNGGPAEKDEALAELNAKLGTRYERKHLDNWLAGRKPIPRTVFDLWFLELISGSVSDPDANEIKRLYKR